MPVAIKGTGGGSVTLTAGAAAADTTLTLPNTSGTVINTAPSTSGNVLTSNGTAWVSSAPAGSTVPSATAIGQVPFSTDGSTWTSTQKIVQGTAVVSTSGTSITFTGIPSWAKRITVMFNDVSTSGTSYILIQIGSGSTTNTGYASQCWSYTTTSNVVTSGFAISSGLGTDKISGYAQIVSFGSNTWVSNGTFNYDTIQSTGWSSAGKSPALSGALDRVIITMFNGTDTFDAGSINIMYE